MDNIRTFNYDTDRIIILVEQTDKFKIANKNLILEYWRNNNLIFTTSDLDTVDDVIIHNVSLELFQDIFAIETKSYELNEFIFKYITYMKTKKYVNYLWIGKLESISENYCLRKNMIHDNIKLFVESISDCPRLKYLLLSFLN